MEGRKTDAVIRRAFTILAAAAALALSGCQTLDPYTNESKFSNAKKGAAIGAAAGAAGAAIVSGKRKNVLLAAGDIWLAHGYSMDVYQAAIDAIGRGDNGYTVTQEHLAADL